MIDPQAKWREGLCPVINGIVWPTGEVDLLGVQALPPVDGKTPVRVTRGDRTDLSSLAGDQGLDWVVVDELCSATEEKQELVAVGGEGGLGSDGFVALLRGNDNSFLWLAFFDNCNPFVQVEFRNRQLVARTNLSNEWRFPWSNPAAVEVGLSERWMGGLL